MNPIFQINDFIQAESCNHTAAFQRAFDLCRNEGGTIVVPKGEYYIASVELFSNTTLYLERGAILYGIQDSSLYRKSYEITEETFMHQALFICGNAENIKICGEGCIDGRGDKEHFPPQGLTPSKQSSYRPKLFSFYCCQNVILENITLKNPAGWGLLFQYCDDLRFHALTLSFLSNFNNDGFDLDACHNVFISNCTISTGDDAICPKCTHPRGCKNIVVSDCIIQSNTAGFKLGTSSYGNYENILVNNCIFRDCKLGTIKLTNVDGGQMKNIRFNNLIFDQCEGPIFIRLGQRDLLYGHQKQTTPPCIQNVHFSNISGTVASTDFSRHGILITGTPKRHVSNISFSHIDISFPGGSTYNYPDIPEDETRYPEQFFFGELPASTLYARHADEIDFHNVKFTVREKDIRPPIVTVDCVECQTEEIVIR